ncbi:MAG TPA: glycosyltransferase family 4 protein [Vicinamibacterales bacterium]|nr:glycosyltransferase family 4 protein [Vicinamibacterales bacterium]
MKLLVLADTRFPIERANGVQTMATCHALASRGHAVTLVVRPDTAQPPRDPFMFYGLPRVSGFDVRTISASPSVRARRAQFLLAALRLALADREVVVYTRDLGCASMLVQLPRARRPPVVYESHGLSVTVAEELPHLLGNPDLTPSAQKLRRLDRRERRVWARAEAYVTITRLLAADLQSRYGPRQRFFVVPDGADRVLIRFAVGDLQTFGPGAPGARATAAAGPAVAAYAGHLYPWKGVDVFIRALAQAPKINGLIIGGHPGEPDRARIEKLIADLQLSDRVTITGLVPPQEVVPRLTAADVLVLPNSASTMSERYTSPLKLFEYLTLGRPIVASDLPAIREVLTDGRTALLVPPGNPQALAQALTRVVEDRALGDALGAAARALAPEYSWARRAERLEAALDAARSQ